MLFQSNIDSPKVISIQGIRKVRDKSPESIIDAIVDILAFYQSMGNVGIVKFELIDNFFTLDVLLKLIKMKWFGDARQLDILTITDEYRFDDKIFTFLVVDIADSDNIIRQINVMNCNVTFSEAKRILYEYGFTNVELNIDHDNVTRMEDILAERKRDLQDKLKIYEDALSYKEEEDIFRKKVSNLRQITAGKSDSTDDSIREDLLYVQKNVPEGSVAEFKDDDGGLLGRGSLQDGVPVIIKYENDLPIKRYELSGNDVVAREINN